MKLLIVEDEKTIRMTLQRLLETQGYDVLAAENGREGWEIFEREKDDIYFAIIDWMMPEMNGLELCRRIKETSVPHYVYVMFLTGKKDRESVIKGFETGADDYIIKPFNRKEVLARLSVGERIVDLEKKLKERNELLHILAIKDGLTGILNRRALFERLGEELFRSDRIRNPLCLIMLDIDHFKKVNDVHGHVMGDKALIEVVNRIKSALEPYDIIGRYGGEEFLVGTSVPDPEIGRMIAERLRVCVGEKPFEIDGENLNVRISLGVTSIIPSGNGDRGNILEAAIKSADSALYRAKEKGRNRVECG